MWFFVLHNFQTSYLGVVRNVFMLVPAIHSSIGIWTHITAHYTALCRMIKSRIILQLCRSHDIMNSIYFLWRKTCILKKEFNILYCNCNPQLDFLCEKRNCCKIRNIVLIKSLVFFVDMSDSTVKSLVPHVQRFGVSIDFGQSMFCNFVKC